MSKGRQVPITNKRTGEVRLSGPVPSRTLQREESSSPAVAGEAEPASTSTPQEVTREPGDAHGPSATESASGPVKNKRGEKIGLKDDKAESLGHYIEYAYGRKGQKLASLKVGEIRHLANNFKLGEREAELLSLAEKDLTLAVPRQLVFITHEFKGHPLLRAELMGFVKKAILQHPLFREQPALTLFIHQGDFCPSALEAMRLIQEFGTTKEAQESDLSRAELDALHRNASYLVAVWLREMRGRSLHDVAEVLFQGVWNKAAASIEDDNDKLRAMTDVSELAPVAVACAVFQQQAEEQTKRAHQSAAESLRLRQERDALLDENEKLRNELAGLQGELEREKRDAQERLATLESSQDVKVTHLRDDNQQVRHRLVKRLVSDVEQLETGLSALRNPNPRVEVMIQRAERVVDALRTEIAKLREE